MTAGSSQTVILVVEDDPAIRRGLVDALSYAGYTPLECDNGTVALERAVDPAIELVLLDVMLPGQDGFAVLEHLRRVRPTLPVIMVTARGSEEDRVRGLKDGADDYVVKPFSAKELLARVEAVLRRAPESRWGVRSLQCEAGRIDLEHRTIVRTDGTTMSLTELEVAILRVLAANRENVVNRQNLLRRVWGMNPAGVETRTVDMHIARLREKIEATPSAPSIILTIRGRGYKLADTVTAEGS